ncbi:serine hydrolase [Aurantibacter sp.]|uniref:serine hydrolase n=1 Tax=Aurantibacter sp. TaxID=2807103 RepID=UPI003267AD08
MKLYLNQSIWLVVITIFFTNCSTQIEPLPDDLTQNIQNRIEYGLNGAIAIGIIDQDGIRYYNFGTRDSSGAAVNEHSIFEIGSISKTFTATLLADQTLNGDLKLEDPINELLPNRVEIPVLAKQQITLGQLSDHTSGLPNMPRNFKPANQKNPFADYTPLQMYEFISNYTPTREAGTNFEYSNLAFGLLGHTLSLHVGKTYEDLVSEVITGPLGMKETKITFDEQMINNLAVGKNEFGQSTENWNFSTLAGAGAIRSSTSDMIKYLSAQLGLTQSPLMQAFELTQHKRHEMYRVRRGDNPLGMGLGWIIDTNSDGNTYWHGGSTGGYTSYIGFNKTMQKGVVVLATGHDPSDIGAYLMYADSLNEIKRSLSTELARKIDLVGAKKTKAFFEDSVVNNLEEFSYGSFPLNRLGRIYLEENSDASIVIFEINIKLFPNDWNTYNNYGEALRKKGRFEESLESYQKSVQLNPENQTGLNSITELKKAMGIGQY